MSLLLLTVLLYSTNLVTSSLVLESGYTVTTVADFSKPPSNIHPFALLPRHRSNDAIMLDSASSVFYTVPVPVTQENGVSHFSGRGVPGFDDGDKTIAMFDKPRSFSIDGKDNVYVSDKLHGAIRKISPSGATTTIAGGYSEKSGHIDGPAQNASFSNDFDLVYVPGICALLISDRGNRLIRQLNLKPEDCIQNTSSGLGSASVSAIAVVSLLIGLVSGLIIRPFCTKSVVSLTIFVGTKLYQHFITIYLHKICLCNCLPSVCRQETCSNRSIDKTWKHYQMKLQSLVWTTYSDIRRGVANSAISQLLVQYVRLCLSYLVVVSRNIRLKILSMKAVLPPLIKPVRKPCAHLRDLISFDERIDVYKMNECSEDNNATESAIESDKVEDLISANLLDFGKQSEERVHSTLVHRKPMRSSGM